MLALQIQLQKLSRLSQDSQDYATMVPCCSDALPGTKLPAHMASASALRLGAGRLRKRLCRAGEERSSRTSYRLGLPHGFVKRKLSVGPRNSLTGAGLWRRWRECAALARPQLALPLIAPSDNWGMWSVLLSIGAFGIWSENTKLGSTLSGALVSTLVALFASNAGIIASESPAYGVVNSFLLPMSVPLLLYSADLRRVVASTGRLLIAFCLGSVATIIGTLVAMVVVPLHTLGADGWKISAALMSRHIGGAVNYVAVSEAFGLSSSALAAGLAADNLICAIYFMTLFALASKVPVTSSEESSVCQVELQDKIGPRSYILKNATALAFSACICTTGVYLAQSLGIPGGRITCITAVVVLLATVFPLEIGALAPAGEALAIILMQVFFAVVGASGSIASVMNTAPSLFIFSLVQISVHLAIILGVGRILGLDQRQLLLASNANVGGPTTAAGLATAKGWKDLVVPGILVGIFGVAIATFISIFLGVTVLRRM